MSSPVSSMLASPVGSTQHMLHSTAESVSTGGHVGGYDYHIPMQNDGDNVQLQS